MIQLANDPNASRSFVRTPPADPKAMARIEARRPRSAHAWPFLSRAPQIQPDHRKPAANDSGS